MGSGRIPRGSKGFLEYVNKLLGGLWGGFQRAFKAISRGIRALRVSDVFKKFQN